MTTIQIKHRYTGAVLYECEAQDGMESGLQMRHALEQATAAKKDLSGAYLSGAYLSGAYLSGANLSGAYLSGAYLSGADMIGANLSGANLSGAYLSGANLSSAKLRGAKLYDANLSGASLGDGKKLLGERPVLNVGPIGSRCDYMTACITEVGVYVQAGCFFGSLEQFELAAAKKHGDNKHGREYAAAVELIKVHAEIWMPEKEVQP